MVLDICKKINATKYISGPFGRDYLDTNSFNNRGIDVMFHDYSHPIYNQTSSSFISHLSVVDLIFNHGKNAKEILQTSGTKI